MFISSGQVRYEYWVQEIENCKQRKSARTNRILLMKYLPLSLLLYFFIISYWLPKIKELELFYIFICDIFFTLKWDVSLPFSFFTLMSIPFLSFKYLLRQLTTNVVWCSVKVLTGWFLCCWVEQAWNNASVVSGILYYEWWYSKISLKM